MPFAETPVFLHGAFDGSVAAFGRERFGETRRELSVDALDLPEFSDACAQKIRERTVLREEGAPAGGSDGWQLGNAEKIKWIGHRRCRMMLPDIAPSYGACPVQSKRQIQDRKKSTLIRLGVFNMLKKMNKNRAIFHAN